MSATPRAAPLAPKPRRGRLSPVYALKAPRRPAPTPKPKKKRRVWLPLIQRVVAGVMPTADGGAPLALRHAGTRFLWAIATGVGFMLGAGIGLLIALASRSLPDTPQLLLGLMAGATLGVAIALFAIGMWMRGKRGAVLSIAVAPLLVAAAPLLLAAAAWASLRRLTGPPKRKGSDDACPEPSSD